MRKYSYYQKRPGTLRRKLASVSASLVLLTNSVGFSLPILLTTQRAAAATSYSAIPFTPSEVSNWTVDRSLPSGGHSSVSFGGRDNVLEMSVDNTNGNPLTGIFYNTEGLKRDITDSDAVKTDLFVDSTWLTKQVRAGLWGVGRNAGNAVSSYPIVEFTTAGVGGFTGWRVWDGTDWVNLTGVSYNADSWNTLEIALNDQTGFFDLSINDSLVDTNAGGGTVAIGEVILNTYNYETSSSDDYDVRWSNFATGGHVADTQTTSTVVVNGNTAAGENQLGWLFNRDASTSSPYEFNANAASIGSGSLYAEPISTTPNNKFVGEYFALKDIADINSVSYDFKIGAGGTAADANEFYMNVYANFGSSSPTKYYDCRYNVVPTIGSTSGFTTVTFDPTASYSVAKHGSSPYNCPSVPAEMNLLSIGSSVRAFAINMGDTTANDIGVDGYFDNFVFNTKSAVTTFDFDPDTAAPVVTINTPAGDVVTKSSVPVNVTVTDDYENNTLSVYLNDAAGNYVTTCTSASNLWFYPAWVTSYTADCTIDTAGLAEGAYTLIAAAQDRTGKYAAQDTRTITVDRTRPALTVTDPNDGTYNSSSLPTIDVEASDANGLASSVVVNLYQGPTLVRSLGTKPTGNSTTFSGSWVIPTDLPEGTYTIRAGVNDLAGNNRTDNDNTFTIDNTAPDTPAHISPANNSFQNYNDFYFDWTDVTGGVEYEFQSSQSPSVDGSGALNSGVWNNKLHGGPDRNHLTSSEIHSYGANGTWYWQVRAIDAAGNQSAWSAPWAMTIDMVAPDAPVLLSPGNGTPINGSSPTANDWESVAGALYYTYQSYNVDGSGNCNLSSIRWTENYANSQTNSRVLADGLKYCWRVKAVDAAGNQSGWSELWMTVVDNSAPAVPVHNSPADGAVRTTADQTLIDWNDVSDPSGVTYFYQSSTSSATNPDGSFASPAYTSGALASSEIPTPGTPEGTWYWHVQAVDGAGNQSDWSDAWTIIVDNTAPSFTLNSIENSSSTSRTISGVTEPGATVEVTVHSTPQTQSTTADSSGNWSLLFSGLEVGLHNVAATSTDTAGNTTTENSSFEVTAGAVQGVSTDTPSTASSSNSNGGSSSTRRGNASSGEVLAVETDTSVTDNQAAQNQLNEANTLAANNEFANSQETSATGCGKFIGLCWYYWIPIVAIVLVVLGIAYGNRRDKSDTI